MTGKTRNLAPCNRCDLCGRRVSLSPAHVFVTDEVGLRVILCNPCVDELWGDEADGCKR